MRARITRVDVSRRVEIQLLGGTLVHDTFRKVDSTGGLLEWLGPAWGFEGGSRAQTMENAIGQVNVAGNVLARSLAGSFSEHTGRAGPTRDLGEIRPNC